MAGGIISLLAALDMLSNRRQQRKEQGSDIASQDDLSAGYPAADWPGGHHSVMVVSSGAGGYLKLSLLGLVALFSYGRDSAYPHCHKPCRVLCRRTRHIRIFQNYRNYSGDAVDAIYH